MATTTAKLTISSADLLSDTLNLNVTSTLTDAGGSTGMIKQQNYLYITLLQQLLNISKLK